MKKILLNISYHMKNTFGRTIFKYILFVQPILHSILLYMIYIDSSDQSFIEYALFGTGMMSFWTVILFSSASDIERERNEGTLSIIFITPQNFYLTMFFKMVANIILGLIPIAISISLLFYLRPVEIKLNIYQLFFILLLGILNLTLLSTIFSFAFALSKNTRLLMNNLEYPLYIISGMVFPITILPNALQIIAKTLPLYWMNKGLRDVLNNEFSVSSWLVLLCFLIFYIFISKPIFNFFIKKVKIIGSIEVM